MSKGVKTAPLALEEYLLNGNPTGYSRPSIFRLRHLAPAALVAVVTIGAIVGMAAHLAGKGFGALDLAGLAVSCTGGQADDDKNLERAVGSDDRGRSAGSENLVYTRIVNPVAVGIDNDRLHRRIEGIAERQHRHDVLHLGKAPGRRSADLARQAVQCAEIGEARLDGIVALPQRVVPLLADGPVEATPPDALVGIVDIHQVLVLG